MGEADRQVTALARDGGARVLFVEATGLCREVARRHGLKGRSVGLAAEMSVANLLLGAWIKGEERVQLQLQAEEPESSFMGEVDALGHFRGRFSPRVVEGRGLALRGMLLAIKADARQEMYRGVTSVMDESVGHALARHLASSDQVPAVVRIEVDVAAGHVVSAQGLVVERLPGPEDEDEDAAYGAWLSEVEAVGADAIAGAVEARELAGEALDVVETRALTFRCRCSAIKVEGMLLGLGPDTLRQMRDEDHGAEITCSFCGEVYKLTEGELDHLVGRLEADA